MIAVGIAINQFAFAYLILEAELGYDSSFQPLWQLSDTVMKKYTYYTWFNENLEMIIQINCESTFSTWEKSCTSTEEKNYKN